MPRALSGAANGVWGYARLLLLPPPGSECNALVASSIKVLIKVLMILYGPSRRMRMLYGQLILLILMPSTTLDVSSESLFLPYPRPDLSYHLTTRNSNIPTYRRSITVLVVDALLVKSKGLLKWDVCHEVNHTRRDMYMDTVRIMKQRKVLEYHPFYGSRSITLVVRIYRHRSSCSDPRERRGEGQPETKGSKVQLIMCPTLRLR